MSDYLNNQPFDEALRERALAVLSAMLLKMEDTNLETGIYRDTFPVRDEGILAEYDMTIVVRKKKEIQKSPMTELLRELGYNV